MNTFVLQQQLSSAQLTKPSHDLDFTFSCFHYIPTYERFAKKKTLNNNSNVLDFTSLHMNVFKILIKKYISYKKKHFQFWTFQRLNNFFLLFMA